MKLAIISDLHLGYAYNTERGEDSFTQAREAIQKALGENVDAILLAGDIFDSRVPSQDVLGKAMQLFLPALTSGSRGVELDSAINKNEKEIPQTVFSGTPIIAIHGTHERRGRGLTNSVQLLEKAGILIHLHCSAVVLKKELDRVAVHGMSGVPEKYARQVLEEWSPLRVDGAKNVLMLHQSLEGYVYSDEDHPTLKLEDLPQDFDLVVDGHIHWADEKLLGRGKFIIPGSTIITQMRKIEAEKPKGFFTWENEGLQFKELKSTRKFYYRKLNFEDSEPDAVAKKLDEEIAGIPDASDSGKKPLVKILLGGTLKDGFAEEDLKLIRLEQECHDKILLSIDKGKLKSHEALNKRHLVERLRQKQLSVDEMGLELLRKHLVEFEYNNVQDPEHLLNLLAAGNQNAVFKYLEELGGNL